MIRLLLAEDQAMVRGALCALLELEPDLTVVAEARDGVEALALAAELQPDICIFDIEMPRLDGLTATARLREVVPAARIVILTTFARSGYLSRALRAGASAYLLKDAPADQLATAIRRVAAGGRVIDPELAAEALSEPNPLNERQRETLALAAAGQSSGQIARSLHLSEGTVRNYLSEVISLLGARNRTEAAQIASTHGWL